jgi:phosphohistidine phosphatase
VLRLLLYRHAKSDWGDPALDDIDRPLNTRGRAAARAMAAYVAEENLLPDLILCSTAQRTRETLAKLTSHLNRECEIRLRRDLYWQGEDSYLTIIRSNGGSARTLMVIGHNPATESTAQELMGSGPEDAIRDIGTKYPTAAIAVLDFAVDKWTDLTAESGRLERFVKPRDLDIPGD